MAFADDFERHVIPMLRQACRLHGLFVVVGSETWSQGYASVMSLAINRGAMRLPESALDALHERISSGLLAGCAYVQPAWDAKQVIANRVAADIAKTYG